MPVTSSALRQAYALTYEQVKASIHPMDLSNVYNSFILGKAELRDVTGEAVPTSATGRYTSTTVQPGTGAGIETPGHCYYILITYTNLNTGEIIGQEIEDLHCIPPDGGGGGGGESGGGSGGSDSSNGPNADPGNQDLCGTFKNAAGIAKYMEMLTKVLAALNSSSNEIAYSYNWDANGNFVSVMYTGTPGSVTIGALAAGMEGFVHTHTANDYPIFSLTDFTAMYALYGSMNSTATFVGQVWTPSGVYGLTILLNF